MQGRQDHWFCTIPGCNKKHTAKGYCLKHYTRFKRYGTVNLTRLPEEERFHAKYIPEPTGDCWLWIGGDTGNGYGRIRRKGGKKILAHRLSWELHNGPIPDGLCVLHKCDTPPCVNPDHLFLGTQKDNIQDAFKKGRLFIPKGEDNKQSKLKNEDIIEIRKLREQGYTQVLLGKMFGVRHTTIGNICNNKTWKHVA